MIIFEVIKVVFLNFGTLRMYRLQLPEFPT